MEWQTFKGIGSSDSALFSETNLGMLSSAENFDTSHLHQPFQPQPYLEILIQPQSKFRFRYKSEMTGKHGSLLGNIMQVEQAPSSSTSCPSPNSSKIYPTVKLHNFHGEAVIHCSLSCDQPPYYPHPHVLHTFDTGGSIVDVPYPTSSGYLEKPYAEINVSQENEHTAAFQGLNIIYTGKKGIKKELMHKSSQLQIGDLRKIRPENIDELSLGINLNVVLLYFEAFVRKPDSSLQSICCPVVSTPIQHNKSTQTSELRIVRIDKYTSCCTGDEEVFILVEKVDKHNIQVKVYQENEKGLEVWKAYGKFSKLDVHHQYAIVFRTPPYRSFEIDTDEEVFIQLERPSDGATSLPIPFRYKPIERIRKMPKRQKIRSGTANQGSSSSTQQPNRDVQKSNPKIPEAGSGNDPGDDDGTGSARQGHGNTFPCNFDKMKNDVDTLCANGISAINLALNVGASLHTWAETSDFTSVLLKLRHLLCLVNENGDNTLHTAIMYQQWEPFKRILAAVTTSADVANIINSVNLQNLTPLSIAVLTNGEKYVKELLKHDIDMSLTNLDGDNAIHLAIKSNHLGCLKQLLMSAESSHNINSRNYNSLAPLHLAVLENNFVTINLLLNASACLISQEGTYGRTPLHIAVENDNFTSCLLLLKADIEGKSIDIQNYRGDTALNCAADPTIKNYTQNELDDGSSTSGGYTAFEETSNKDIVMILNGNSAEWEQTLKPFLEPNVEKDFSRESIPVDSGIDIKELP